MSDQIQDIVAQARQELEAAADERGLKETEVKYLGKKGLVTGLMSRMRDLAPAERPGFGKLVNQAKGTLTALAGERRKAIKAQTLMLEVADPYLDPTLPGIREQRGMLHPLTTITEEVEDIFRSMGFIIPDYPEAESEFFNFESLNIPEDHPARDTQDTFWLKDGNLLRTHTSPGQIRAMPRTSTPSTRWRGCSSTGMCRWPTLSTR